MRIILGSDLVHYQARPGAFDNRLAYVRGLEQLGHEVFLFTELNPDREGGSEDRDLPFPNWQQVRRFAAWAEGHGFHGRYCVLCEKPRAGAGMSLTEAGRIAKSADLLINISGKIRAEEIVDNVRQRVFVDLAPAKTQVYHTEYGIDQGFDRHQHFFTVGRSIGQPGCPVPTAGVQWHPLWHPVYLPDWPRQEDAEDRAFNTITDWSGKETFHLQGTFSGEKSDNWKHYLDLPGRSRHPLTVAVRFQPETSQDAALFTEHGWRVVDANEITTVAAYRDFIQCSRGEFSVANNRYVTFRTGWFSDRTARYLASGKPVLVQSTGLEEQVAVGEGLLTFATLDEAVAGLEKIHRDYEHHCRAAREFAEEHLNASKVLARMLEVIGG